MDQLNGRPGLLKQANLSLIRRALKAKGTATRAELARETKISSTTVRSFLAEMLQNGEIESAGYDESSGGRRAERYCFRLDRYYGAALCATNEKVHGLLVDLCGSIVEKTCLDVLNGNFEPVITAFLDDVTARREIKSIGLGVPGAVESGGYWRVDRESGMLHRVELGDELARRYGVPVLLENDINATAIGFGRCYERQYPCEGPENTNMAYLHFERGCVSAGFLAGGRVIRGWNHFAGELGLVPTDGERLLDECMAEPLDDVEYVRLLIQTIGWVCGILNPQYIALGGPGLRAECIGPVGDGLSALLPKQMQAELLYAPDVWHDYNEGMAHLTASKIFDEIQLIKE